MSKFNNKTIQYILAGILIVAVLGFLITVTTSSITLKVDSQKITVNSGDPTSRESMEISKIKDVYLKDTIPSTNKIIGTAIGNVQKGSFNVDGLGRGHVFVESNKGPFLYVISDNDFIIYESKDSQKVNNAYKQILEKTGIKK